MQNVSSPTAPLPSSSPRVLPLETCRGIAAGCVFLHHFALAFRPQLMGGTDDITGSPLNLLVNGKAAVAFFFVLSGYVLTQKFFRTGDARILAQAAIKRLPRLAGPVTVITFLSYLLFVTHAYHFREAAAVTGSEYLQSFGFADLPADFVPTLKGALMQGAFYTFLRGDYGFNSLLWTMHIEFVGSLLVFGIALMFSHAFGKRNLFVPAILLAFAFWYAEPYYIAFLCGTLLSVHHSFRPPRVLARVAFPLFALCLLFFGFIRPAGFYAFLDVARFAPNNDRLVAIQQHLPLLIHIVAAVVMIQVVLGCEQLFKAFDHGPGRVLGRISFPLYLCHTLIIWSFSSWFYVAMAPRLGATSNLVVDFGLTATLVLAVALLLAHFDGFWNDLVGRVTGRLLAKA